MMVKPHGMLRYQATLGALGVFQVDPFIDPDEFGNVIGLPGGVPQVPGMLWLWPLQLGPGGNFGEITIFPSSINFDPVTGNTIDVVLDVTNNSAGVVSFFLGIYIPPVWNMAN
jgi:hypothetical protein